MLDFVLYDESLKKNDDVIAFDFNKESFLEGILYFKVHHDFLFLLDYSITRKEKEVRVKVVLQSLEKRKIVVLKTRYDQGDELFSLKGVWPAASGWERHYEKGLGLNFNSTDNKLTSDFKKVPLSFDIAHQFPAFLFDEEEERVKSFNVETSGRIAMRENFHSLKNLQNLSKYNPKDTINNEITYCMAIEKSLGIEIPEKAQAVRMIFSELQRIVHHLEFLIQTHIALNDFVFLNELINFRRKVYDLYTFYTGKDFDISFNYIGGVAKDIPAGWIPMCNETLKTMANTLRKTYESKIENSLWNQRFSRFEVSAEKLLGHSVSGPNLRAGGINYDLRKNAPYYFYQDVDFDVPIGIWGTSFDRFLCRLEEIQQAVRIILQVLDNLPYGEAYSKDERLIYNLQKDLTTTSNQNIYHELLTKGDKLNAGHFVGMVESARGSTGFVLEVEEEIDLQYIGAHFASIYALETHLIGLHRHYIEREIASYGFHPWERS